MQHSISEQTKVYQTAWFFVKGLPTLLEVHQVDQLSSKPKKVSQIQLPLCNEHKTLFEGIGLGESVYCSDKLTLVVDDQMFNFSDIVNLT